MTARVITAGAGPAGVPGAIENVNSAVVKARVAGELQEGPERAGR
jgi:hypothetical protein